MRGPVFGHLSFLSLLLCTASAVWWLRSYSVTDTWVWGRGRSFDGTPEYWFFTSTQGRFIIDGGPEPEPRFGERRLSDLTHGRTEFEWVSDPVRSESGLAPHGGIPIWRAVAFTGLLPLWWLVQNYHTFAAQYRAIVGSQRLASGHCPSCNYDLRATPERCPECGWEGGEAGGGQPVNRLDYETPQPEKPAGWLTVTGFTLLVLSFAALIAGWIFFGP